MNYEESFKHFSKIESQEKSSWPDIRFAEYVENCQVCSRPMFEETYMIDGPASKKNQLQWGCLCIICALKSSPKIGWGRAQLYKNAGTYWQLIAGGPPVDDGI
ncbi:MAG TPA: hypothetical protein VNC39_04335 [Acidocella sp.]|uniref:hypothetical protein n=1 Tax=Acidocella sp. TaxID=50710 RepID=UPI002C3442DE|nr:hypothetical protein [Acidocella sp.]HVE21180.1 hypothetical protein [Acidocella sp.]